MTGSGRMTLLVASLVMLGGFAAFEIRHRKERQNSAPQRALALAKDIKRRHGRAGDEQGGMLVKLLRRITGRHARPTGSTPLPLEDPDEVKRVKPKGSKKKALASLEWNEELTFGGGGGEKKSGARMGGPRLLFQLSTGRMQEVVIDLTGASSIDDVQDAVAHACEQALPEYEQQRLGELVMQAVDCNGEAQTVTGKMKPKKILQARELRLVAPEDEPRWEELTSSEIEILQRQRATTAPPPLPARAQRDFATLDIPMAPEVLIDVTPDTITNAALGYEVQAPAPAPALAHEGSEQTARPGAAAPVALPEAEPDPDRHGAGGTQLPAAPAAAQSLAEARPPNLSVYLD
jgi:hypothetical protein